MKCHFVIILVWLKGAQGSDTAGHEIKQSVNYGDSGYPLVEVTGVVGFIWLFQGNITFSPAKLSIFNRVSHMWVLRRKLVIR